MNYRSIFFKGSLLRFLVLALLAQSVFVFPIPLVQAATCNVTSTQTIDQAYIDAGNCDTLNISGTFVVTWSGTTDLVGAGTVNVTSGTVTFSGAMILGSTDDFTVSGGATVTHAQGNTIGVSITARNATITGSINTNGKGCQGGVAVSTNGYGPDLNTGVCTQTTTGYGKFASGGGYGGSGGSGSNGSSSASSTYGSATAPTYLGSGGGGESNGGAVGGYGGGKVRLDLSGTLDVSGTVTANGLISTGASYGGGGGAGGSIYVTTVTLAGAGSMTVNGGNGKSGGNYMGGGGGGRVAVYYDTLSGFTRSNITSTKGLNSGGAALDGSNGSTFILNRKVDDGVGDLYVTSGLDFQTGVDYQRTNITALSGSRFTCGTFATLDLAASAVLDFQGVSWTCTTVDTINITANTWTTSGTNVMNFNKAGGIVNWSIANNLTLNNLTYTGGAAGLSSGNGGLLTMNSAISLSLVGTTLATSASFMNLTALTVDATSSISANGKGCQAGVSGSTNGYGPEASTNVCAQGITGYGKFASGAGHGGAGGAGSNGASSAGSTYDSQTAPVLFGSGGGAEANGGSIGGAGGGKIRLNVSGTLTINGSISANGLISTGTSYGGGGGSGGAIYITTTTLAGSGSVSLSGGNGLGGGNHMGGGGGGRVAMYYTTNTGFNTANVTAVKGLKSGGSAVDGTDGTVYLLQYTAPATPSISSPIFGSHNVSRTPTLLSTAYSSNGASHFSTDWKIKTDSTCTNDTGRVWYKDADTSNLTSILANDSSGTFTGALSGQTMLASFTTYYACVRYTNSAGNSSWSSSVLFTTSNVSASATQNLDFGTAGQYTYDSTYVDVAAGDTYGKLKNLSSTPFPEAYSAWSSRQEIGIGERSGTNLSNFQVSIPVTFATGMQSDFDDIRFTASDGSTAVDFWRETYTASSSATFWVEVPTLNANSGATLYMYYGNAAATSLSNGPNTFMYFDDFENSSITTSNWTFVGNLWNVTGGYLNHPTTNSGVGFAFASVNASTAFTNGVLEMSMRPVSCGASFGKGFIARYTSTNSMYVAGLEAWNAGQTHVGKRVGGVWSLLDNDNISCSTSTWYSLKYTLNGSSLALSVNNGAVTSSATDASLTSGKVGVQVDNNETATGADFDNFRVRKYASVDPVVSFGSTSPTYATVVAATTLSGWTYRKAITITETSGSTLSNFQVQIPVPYLSAMQNDFDDLRFTSSDGTTELDYFIQRKVDGGYAKVWVEVPTLSASSATTLYMYYGNSGVSTTSSVGNTLLFFDDFNDGNYTGWTLETENTASQTVDIVSGQLHILSPSNNTTYLTADATAGFTDVIVEADVTLLDSGGIHDAALMTRYSNISNFFMFGADMGESGNMAQSWRRLSGVYTSISSVTKTWAIGQLYRWKVSVGGTTLKFHVDDTLQFSATDSNLSSGKIGVHVDGANNSSGDEAYYDNIVVRKYAASDPTVSIGVQTFFLVAESAVSMTSTPALAPTVLSLGTFTETLGTGSTGTVNYQLSVDGSTWKYFNGSNWVTATASQYNSAATVNNYLPQLITDVSKGRLYVRTILSGANQFMAVDNLAFTYEPLNVSLTAATQTVAENVGSVTVTAQLSATFSSDVIIPYTVTGTSTGGGVDHNLANGNITVTTGATTGTAIFTVTADAIDENNETVIVTLGTPDYGQLSGTTEQTITITDDDTSGVTVTESGGTAVTEGGATDTYTVVLNTQPLNDVTITVTSNAQVSVSSASLVFTTGNWNTPQVITLTAVNDLIAEGNHNGIASHTVASADTLYNAIGIASVTASVTDNDAAGITVGAISGNVAEAGTTASFSLVLTSQPTNSVSIGLSSSDTTEGTVGPSSLTFTTENWNTPQTTTVTGVNDDIDDGDIVFSIMTAAATSSDTTYNGINASNPSLSNLDDDTAGIALSSSSLSGTEGGTATYTLVLLSEPTANVVITSTGDGQVSVLGPLTFTNLNWSTPQSVTVALIDDTIVESVHTGVVTHGVNSLDVIYNAFVVGNVTVNITDNDTAGGGFVPGHSSQGGSSSTTKGGTDDDEEEEEPEEVEEVVSEFDLTYPEHWSEGYLKHLEDESFVVEVAANESTFFEVVSRMFSEPNSGIDRAESLEFLLVLSGIDVGTIQVNTSRLSFTDVLATHIRAAYIEFAYDAGLVTGYPDGSFKPELVVNRVEALKMVSLFFGLDVEEELRGDDLLEHHGLTENPFADADMQAWYAPYLINMYANGVVQGYGDGTFGCGNNVTYAEFLKITTLSQSIENAVELASELE